MSSTERQIDHPVVVIGLGQLGGVFAHALLRDGHTVFPVRRQDDLVRAGQQVPVPTGVLITVGEADLGPVLDALPESWRARIALVQNELLPETWTSRGYADPTVIVVWFEKKRGIDTTVLLPSPVFGPDARLYASALDTLDLPTRSVAGGDEALEALVEKNLYILTLNIGGLVENVTAGTLWNQHGALARSVAEEVLDLQEALVGQSFDRGGLIARLDEAIAADPEHGCRGRSSQARLARALSHARARGLELTQLEDIARRVNP